jgi:zinc transporter
MPKGGLICAYLLDGAGGGKALGWEEVKAWAPEQGLLWVHLDYSEPDSQDWVADGSGIDAVTAEALLAEETRPRSEVSPDGVLVFLRGVNLNPGADPEDMVSVRLWLQERRVISLRRRRLLSVDDVRRTLEKGAGPRTAGELLVHIADRMVARVADVIDGIDDSVDELEDQVLTAESHGLRTQLSNVRRDAIALRRYLAPQREAMQRLTLERVPWLSDLDRVRLREQTDRVMRYVEDLDAARDRAGVTQEELAGKLSEQLNSRMYVLSVIAGIFLPISFVTGLLGVNVGGIPGTEDPWAFSILTLVLAVTTALQVVLFKRRRWL